MDGWAPRLLNDSVWKATAYSQILSPVQRLNQQPSSSSDLQRLPVALRRCSRFARRWEFPRRLPPTRGRSEGCGGRAPRVCLGQFGISQGGRKMPRTALLPLQRFPQGFSELVPMQSIIKQCQKYRCLPVCDINWNEEKQNWSVKSQSYSHLSSRNKSEMQAKVTAVKPACKKNKNKPKKPPNIWKNNQLPERSGFYLKAADISSLGSWSQ